MGASAEALGPDSKARPRAARVHSKKVADIDESERPIMPLGCDPLESFQPLAVRHAGAGSLNTPNGVFEYCRHQSNFGEELLRSGARELGWKLDAVVSDRGVVPGLEMACVSPCVLEQRLPLWKPSFNIELDTERYPDAIRKHPYVNR